MNELLLGSLIGTIVGFLIGGQYDHWRVSKIVDDTILKYRLEDQKRKNEALKKFLEDEGGEE